MFSRAMLSALIVGALLFSITNLSSAQDQQLYNELVQKYKELNAKMKAPGITPEEYDAFLKESEELQAKIQAEQEKLLQEGDYQEKVNEAKKAFNNGQQAYKKGQFDEALTWYEQAIASKVSSVLTKSYYQKGLSLIRLRKYDEAVAAFHAATEVDPGYAMAFSAMGSAYNKMGSSKLDLAIESYQKAVDLEPEDEKSQYNLGLVYSKKKDYNNAVKHFRAATQLKPDYYKAFNSLGVALKGAGKNEEAAMAFENAIMIKEDYGDAYFRLAEVNNLLGRRKEALDVALKGIQHRGRHVAPCHFEAGQALKSMARYQEAIEHFEAAKKDRKWLKSAEWEIEDINSKRGQ